MPGAGPKVFPLIRYSWSGLGNWRNLNRKRLDSCSSMDLAVQSKGTGERVKRRAVLLSVDQHVLGTRSCLCAQPLFTLAVPLVCGSVNVCIGRTWDCKRAHLLVLVSLVLQTWTRVRPEQLITTFNGERLSAQIDLWVEIWTCDSFWI